MVYCDIQKILLFKNLNKNELTNDKNDKNRMNNVILKTSMMWPSKTFFYILELLLK